jgi:uncharacterized protein (DUF1697 family)
MSRSVAFLRGINVGGHRVKSEELVAVFAGLSLEGVDTFLASGNVLFEPPPAGGAAIDEATIAEAMEAALGYGVPTTVRTGAEIVELAEADPFTDDELAAGGKPQVMLLFSPPAAEDQAQVLALASDDDRLVFGPRALHWLPAGGILDSDLDLKAIEGLVGPTTMRTANTIRRLVPKL